MIAPQVLSHEMVTFEDVKMLAQASGTCLSIVEPLTQPGEIATRLKNSIRTVEKKLAARGESAATIGDLTEPISEVAANVETSGIWAQTMVLFRSAQLIRYYFLDGELKAACAVENRFQVRPLLAALTHEQRFHLLALSRRNTRLYHSTHHRMEEETNGNLPRNMDAWLNNRQPDHVLDNRSSAGPSVGSMKGVPFGTSSDRDRDEEYLAHFLRAVDTGVNELLRDDDAPLVLAGVEYEIAIYRRLNTHRRLLDKAVIGSPDGISSSTLHERATELILQTDSESLQKTLSLFQKHRDAHRALTDVDEIIRAAWQGRVLSLVLSDTAERQGRWNDQTQDIEEGPTAEDLLNAAALETVRHGGQAFVVNASHMPLPGAAAAILRF